MVWPYRIHLVAPLSEGENGADGENITENTSCIRDLSTTLITFAPGSFTICSTGDLLNDFRDSVSTPVSD